jgi:hypothetical protein
MIDIRLAYLIAFITFSMGIALTGAESYSDELSCEAKNNVYDCERLYVPAPTKETP